jgi:hypothetical protein
MSFCLEENKICSNIFLRLTSLVGTYIYIYIYIKLKKKHYASFLNPSNEFRLIITKLIGLMTLGVETFLRA